MVAVVAACVVVAACADDADLAPAAIGDPGSSAASAAEPAPAPEASPRSPPGARAAVRYYEGYLDEVLRGDFRAARAAYREVVADGSAAPETAARAALRLAEYEAETGRRHIALDLVARAAALGRDHRDLLHWAERLQRRLGAVRVHDIEVRGPPAGTPLEGVTPEAAALHARAEALLSAYHARRLRPRLEELRAGVRAKRAAMEAAVRAYRQITALGEPAATVAAELRIASLYYDLSLSLTFDLPTELESGAAAELRQSLRAQALADRARARAAYLRALEAGRDGRAGPAGAIWLEAAEIGLRSVEDLLRGRD
ncbi:MAG TPA: hypothetical protein VK698_34920 [Kofleriaceae bacterium]|nr:hypothetical protein [Kofleriaceae bacterium]